MGGNAFEGTVRLTPAEHARVRQQVMAVLQSDSTLAQTLHVVSSAEILDKPSFGDVDLYASCRLGCASPDQVREAMTEFLAAALCSPARPVRNGRTVSILTPERYQVDVGFAEDASQLAMYATVHSNGDFSRLLQVSLTPLGLCLTTEGFFLRRAREENVSKRDASFLLSVNPKQVGEFLGLPREAFDGRTSLSMARTFELVVQNRFFDGAVMDAWVRAGASCEIRDSKRRPMIVKFCEWWQSTGMSRFGDRRCDCGNNVEAWVDFFGERERFREWKVKGKGKGKEAEMEKECKRSLNFGMIRSWFPEFSNVFIGEVLRKIRGEHGQFGLVEFHGWLRSMSPEDLRNEVFAVARHLDHVQHS